MQVIQLSKTIISNIRNEIMTSKKAKKTILKTH